MPAIITPAVRIKPRWMTVVEEKMLLTFSTGYVDYKSLLATAYTFVNSEKLSVVEKNVR